MRKVDSRRRSSEVTGRRSSRSSDRPGSPEGACYIPRYIGIQAEREKMSRWVKKAVRTDDELASVSLFSGDSSAATNAVATFSSVTTRVRSKVMDSLRLKEDDAKARRGMTEEELEQQYEQLACVWQRMEGAPHESPAPKNTTRERTPAHLTPTPQRQKPPTPARMSKTPTAMYTTMPEPPMLTVSQLRRSPDLQLGRHESTYSTTIGMPFSMGQCQPLSPQLLRQKRDEQWTRRRLEASGHPPVLIEATPMLGGLQRAWSSAEVQLAPFRARTPASGARVDQRPSSRLRLPKVRAESRPSSDDEDSVSVWSETQRRPKQRAVPPETKALLSDLQHFEHANPLTMAPAPRPEDVTEEDRSAGVVPLAFDDSSDEEYFRTHAGDGGRFRIVVPPDQEDSPVASVRSVANLAETRKVGFQSHEAQETKSRHGRFLVVPADAVDVLRELFRRSCPTHQDREDAYVTALGGLSFPIDFPRFKRMIRSLIPAQHAAVDRGMQGGTFRSAVHRASVTGDMLSSPLVQATAQVSLPEEVVKTMYVTIAEKALALQSLPAIPGGQQGANGGGGPRGPLSAAAAVMPVLPYVGYLAGLVQCVLSPKQLAFVNKLYTNMRTSPHIGYYLFHLRHRVLVRGLRKIQKQMRVLHEIRMAEVAAAASTDTTRDYAAEAQLDHLRRSLTAAMSDAERLLTLTAGLSYDMIGDPIVEGCEARSWYAKRQYLLDSAAAQTGDQWPAMPSPQKRANRVRRKTESDVLEEAQRAIEQRLELLRNSSSADAFKSRGKASPQQREQLMLSLFLPQPNKRAGRGGLRRKSALEKEEAAALAAQHGFDPAFTFDQSSSDDEALSQVSGSVDHSRHGEAPEEDLLQATKFATFVVRDVVFALCNVSLQFPHQHEDQFVQAVVQCLADTALENSSRLLEDQAARRQQEALDGPADRNATAAPRSIAALSGDTATCALSDVRPVQAVTSQVAPKPLNPPPLSFLTLDDFRMILFCDDRVMAALETICPAEATSVKGMFQ